MLKVENKEGNEGGDKERSAKVMYSIRYPQNFLFWRLWWEHNHFLQ